MSTWMKIFYWFLVIFVAWAIYQLARKIIGGSLGTEDIILVLVGSNLSYTYYLNTKISEHLGWHKGKERK